MRYASPRSWPRHGPGVLATFVAVAALLVRPQAEDGMQLPPAALFPAQPGSTVIVDPGHGGDDHGAVGATGLEEKALVLDVAQRLQSLAALHGGIRVRLTREDDRSLTLDQRATSANADPGLLFISLHANFSPSPKTAGVEVGTFRGTVASAPEAVAAPRRGGPPPSSSPASPALRWAALVRWDQAQAQHADRASSVAQRLMDRFRTAGTVGPRAWYQAPLKPLAAVNMPAVLLELGYLSNADDEAALASEERQAALAQAVLDVVMSMTDGTAASGGAR